MKPQLVLQLPGASIDAHSVVPWSLFDGDGRLQISGKTALAAVRSEVGDDLRGADTLVLVPGELVLLIRVRIPTRQVRHIKQALPYMVEELIADNIEEVHLAMPGGKLNWDDEMPVAVVRHHLLIDWLDQLYHCGLQPDFLGPDLLATPWREYGRHYFAAARDDQPVRILCRDGTYCGQVVALPNLPVLLAAQARAQTDALAALPHYVVSAGSDAAAVVPEMAALLRQHCSGDIEVAPFAETSAEVLAATAVRERDGMINLLQGGYRVQRRNQGGHGWRRAAIVAAVGLGVYALLAAGGGLYFSWRAQQIERQTFALYRELFPDERRVVSPKKQMANHLRSDDSTEADSMLPLLAKAASSFKVDTNTQIDELHFNQQQKNLQVQVRTPSLDALELIKKQMRANGLEVEIGSANVQGNATVGRLQIREQKS